MEIMGLINLAFWQGKRVLVTGHTGFKGSWLSMWLVMLGASVKGYSLDPPSNPNLYNALALAGAIDNCHGDIRDSEALKRAIHDFRPEIIFHLAAQPLVRLSYKDPRLTYETNVMGTLNLLEAVRVSDSVSVVVVITTDKCYENKEWVWGYREIDPMGGYDPYSSSKGCAELLTASFRFSFFNPNDYGKTHHVALATARAGNVIGGGDWALDRLIPDCIRALSIGKPIEIRNPHSTRPWQHVLEPLSGYLLLAQQMHSDAVTFSEGWNFGPSDNGIMDVENVVKSVIRAWGEGHYKYSDDADFHEANLLKLDISKAKAILKWAPRMKLFEAILKSVEVYKLFFKNSEEIKILVENQINLFSIL